MPEMPATSSFLAALLPVLHFLAGLIVLAEGLNKLERTAPLQRGLTRRRRVIALLKVFAWIALCLGAAGAMVRPFVFVSLGDLHVGRLFITDRASLSDVLVLGGFALLIVRSRLKEPKTMINSRSLDELHPVVRERVDEFLARCADEGIDLLVTSTYRDHASQDALYAQGRAVPGPVVTNARAGYSWHNWRCAVDVVPMRNGKPVWGTSTAVDRGLWERVGEIGEACGLEWAARWKTFPEMAHFQFTGGLTMADFRAGRTLDEAVA